jgi:hypothetical protein
MTNILIWSRFSTAIALLIAVLAGERLTAVNCTTTVEMRLVMARERAAHRDDNEFIVALDRAITAGVFPAEQWVGISFAGQDGGVRLAGPYTLYRFALMEALRKMDPLEEVPVPRGVAIIVSPTRIDSPDIIKVVVQRDGVQIPPITNTLQPTVMRTALGASRTLHAGVLEFPCAAFAPGATVSVIAIPDAGANFTLTLTDSALKTLY